MQTHYDKIWESALRSIQIRTTSREELRRKLMAKFPQEEHQISKVLEEMERVLLLDDKRYTEQLVTHLLQKPIGRIKIQIETRKRGLDPELVDALLIAADYDEGAMAKKALEAKGEIREADPRKRKFKLMNFLRNRGFTDATVYKVIGAQNTELS
jgi:regulatory protein